MKVRVDRDELYPYYFVNDNYGPEVELTEAEAAWIAATEAESAKVQDFLKAKVEGPPS